jgi:hypothetical protein
VSYTLIAREFTLANMLAQQSISFDDKIGLQNVICCPKC